MTQLKLFIRNLIERLVVGPMYCSSRGSEFHSQHLYQTTHSCLTPVSEELILSLLCSMGCCIHFQILPHRDICIHIIKNQWIIKKINLIWLVSKVYVHNFRIWETEKGGSSVPDQPGPHNETMSQKFSNKT